MEEKIVPGRYRHFKGNEYEVIGLARHSETTEEMVVYRALYGDGGLWVRPARMWNETVERDGKTYRRFTLVEAKDAAKEESAPKPPLKGEVARLQRRDGEVFAAASLGRTCRGDPCGRPFPHSARSRRATARVAPTSSQSAPATAPLSGEPFGRRVP